jgi:hypothetical protein
MKLVLQQLGCRVVLYGREVALDLNIPDGVQTCVRISTYHDDYQSTLRLAV